MKAHAASFTVATGTATVLIQHTSASLVIYENADPSARADLHEFFERLVPGRRARVRSQAGSRQ
jgi:thiamine phosphate synthase YjbQ (UPF0047 family)